MFCVLPPVLPEQPVSLKPFVAPLTPVHVMLGPDEAEAGLDRLAKTTAPRDADTWSWRALTDSCVSSIMPLGCSGFG
jgi:hypothetical protein